jgi:hypothetical protein
MPGTERVIAFSQLAVKGLNYASVMTLILIRVKERESATDKSQPEWKSPPGDNTAVTQPWYRRTYGRIIPGRRIERQEQGK